MANRSRPIKFTLYLSSSENETLAEKAARAGLSKATFLRKQIDERGSSNLIPKVFLVEFFCSKAFRSTQRRNAWHIHAVQYFPLWVQCKTLKNAGQATE